MQHRNTASQLRMRRDAKTRQLADLKLQMAEVDPQGGAAAAVLARLEPLGMRRELLQYRLTELEQQMDIEIALAQRFAQQLFRNGL